MQVVHCGDVLPCLSSRDLKPTAEEAKRGVTNVKSFEYCCTKNKCNRKLYYKQEVFELGYGRIQRVKKNIAAWVARLKLARPSDWVLGYCPKTYRQVRRLVQ